MNVDLDLVKVSLERNLSENEAKRILRDLLDAVNERDQKKELRDKEKKQFVVFVDDKDGSLAGKEMLGWVVQVPINDNPADALEKLRNAANEFNANSPRRKFDLSNVAEACRYLPGKYQKPSKIFVKSKDRVFIAPVNNGKFIYSK